MNSNPNITFQKTSMPVDVMQELVRIIGKNNLPIFRAAVNDWVETHYNEFRFSKDPTYQTAYAIELYATCLVQHVPEYWSHFNEFKTLNRTASDLTETEAKHLVSIHTHGRPYTYLNGELIVGELGEDHSATVPHGDVTGRFYPDGSVVSIWKSTKSRQQITDALFALVQAGHIKKDAMVWDSAMDTLEPMQDFMAKTATLQQTSEPIFRSATIIAPNGKLYEGYRHLDAEDKYTAETGDNTVDASKVKYGFTTLNGRFVTREEAANMVGSKNFAITSDELRYYGYLVYTSTQKTADIITQMQGSGLEVGDSVFARSKSVGNVGNWNKSKAPRQITGILQPNTPAWDTHNHENKRYSDSIPFPTEEPVYLVQLHKGEDSAYFLKKDLQLVPKKTADIVTAVPAYEDEEGNWHFAQPLPYDQLPDAIKEKALDNNREGWRSQDDAENEVGLAESDAEGFGLNMKMQKWNTNPIDFEANFDVANYGLFTKALLAYQKAQVKKYPNAVHAVIPKTAWKALLEGLIYVSFYKENIEVSSDAHAMVEYYPRVRFDWDATFDAIASLAEDFFMDLEHKYANWINSSLEPPDNDELSETFRANEYTFDEEGHIASKHGVNVKFGDIIGGQPAEEMIVDWNELPQHMRPYQVWRASSDPFKVGMELFVIDPTVTAQDVKAYAGSQRYKGFKIAQGFWSPSLFDEKFIRAWMNSPEFQPTIWTPYLDRTWQGGEETPMKFRLVDNDFRTTLTGNASLKFADIMSQMPQVGSKWLGGVQGTPTTVRLEYVGLYNDAAKKSIRNARGAYTGNEPAMYENNRVWRLPNEGEQAVFFMDLRSGNMLAMNLNTFLKTFEEVSLKTADIVQHFPEPKAPVKRLPEKFVGWSVSHATMRTVDVMIAVLSFLQETHPAMFQWITKEYSEDFQAFKSAMFEGRESPWWDSEEASEFLNSDLWNAMNAIAPMGTYFGANEGDGSDFGFWYLDADEAEGAEGTAEETRWSEAQIVEILNQMGAPEHDQAENGGRVPDEYAHRYGEWLKENDPMAFDVFSQEQNQRQGSQSGRNTGRLRPKQSSDSRQTISKVSSGLAAMAGEIYQLFDVKEVGDHQYELTLTTKGQTQYEDKERKIGNMTFKLDPQHMELTILSASLPQGYEYVFANMVQYLNTRYPQYALDGSRIPPQFKQYWNSAFSSLHFADILDTLQVDRQVYMQYVDNKKATGDEPLPYEQWKKRWDTLQAKLPQWNEPKPQTFASFQSIAGYAWVKDYNADLGESGLGYLMSQEGEWKDYLTNSPYALLLLDGQKQVGFLGYDVDVSQVQEDQHTPPVISIWTYYILPQYRKLGQGQRLLQEFAAGIRKQFPRAMIETGIQTDTGASLLAYLRQLLPESEFTIGDDIRAKKQMEETDMFNRKMKARNASLAFAAAEGMGDLEVGDRVVLALTLPTIENDWKWLHSSVDKLVFLVENGLTKGVVVQSSPVAPYGWNRTGWKGEVQVRFETENFEINNPIKREYMLSSFPKNYWFKFLRLDLSSNQKSLTFAAVAEDSIVADQDVETNPSQEQIEAGNYKKGHITIHGLDITIENPKGSTRKGVSPDGKEWSNKMHSDYGYIKGGLGKDGDQVDIVIGEHHDSEFVYIVNQKKEGGKGFDEHKCVLGEHNEEDAIDTYLANYDKDWRDKQGGSIDGVAMTMEQFKTWLETADMKKPAEEVTVESSLKFSDAITDRGWNVHHGWVNPDGEFFPLQHGSHNEDARYHIQDIYRHDSSLRSVLDTIKGDPRDILVRLGWLRVDGVFIEVFSIAKTHDTLIEYVSQFPPSSPMMIEEASINKIWNIRAKDFLADIDRYGSLKFSDIITGLQGEHPTGRRITTTYSIITPESAQHGDFAETGWEDDEGVEITVDMQDEDYATEFDSIVGQTVKFLAYHGAKEYGYNSYETVDPERDDATGGEKYYTYHLAGYTQQELKAIEWQMSKRGLIASLKFAKQDNEIFVAIEVPKRVRKKYEHIEDLDEDLHVTMLFVPNVKTTDAQKEKIVNAVAKIAKNHDPLACSFTGLGNFDNGSDTLVALVNVPEGAALHTEIEEEVERINGEWEKRYGYLPHCTLNMKGDGESDLDDLRKFKWTAKELRINFSDPSDVVYYVELGTGKVREVRKTKKTADILNMDKTDIWTYRIGDTFQFGTDTDSFEQVWHFIENKMLAPFKQRLFDAGYTGTYDFTHACPITLLSFNLRNKMAIFGVYNPLDPTIKLIEMEMPFETVHDDLVQVSRKTSAVPQPIRDQLDYPRFNLSAKDTVEQAGAIYDGVKDWGAQGWIVFFTDPTTKSTNVLPLDKLTVDNVKRKLQELQ